MTDIWEQESDSLAGTPKEETYIDETPYEVAQGLYNVKAIKNPTGGGASGALGMGGRHSYDYIPQYAIKAAEQQIANYYEPGTAVQEPTATGARLRATGPAVHNLIVSEYARKGYSLPHANRIAGAVAGKLHRKKVAEQRYAYA